MDGAAYLYRALVDADFQKTWNRYKVPESKPAFSNSLIRAVFDYNTKHV